MAKVRFQMFIDENQKKALSGFSMIIRFWNCVMNI